MSKKKTIIITLIAIFGCLLAYSIFLIPMLMNHIIETKRNRPIAPNEVTGVNLYLDGSYKELESNYYFNTACKTFDSITNSLKNESVTGFYLFDGFYSTGSQTGISFVLDLKFETSDMLNQFYLDELSKYDFYDEFAFNKNNYQINFIKDESITKFRRTKDRPYTYGLICYNENDLILRYVSFIDYQTVDDFSNLFECSNCDW